MPSESTLTRKIIKALRALDNCHVQKIHGNVYQTAGTPDLLGCINGRALAIELKVPGKEPTAIQYEQLRRWRAAGALAGWATSVDEALAIANPVKL